MLENEDGLINGFIKCSYYENDEIRSLEYNLTKYERVTEKEIISEYEAYRQILKGKFSHYIRDINKVLIEDVKLEYQIDTKGYYQPVYCFNAIVNDEDKQPIYIKAIK